MKIGIITDSTCDLPQTKISTKNIHIIPNKIICDKVAILDYHTIDNYKEVNELLKNKKELITQPLSPKEIKNFFIDLIIEHEYDELICILPLQSQNDNYHNTLSVIPQVITEIRKQKQSTNKKSTIKIEVIDSTQISVGLGMIVADAMYRNSQNLSSDKIIEKIHQISRHTQSFLIPNNLSVIYNQNKSQHNMGLATYILGSTLDLKPIILTHLGKTKTIDTIQGFDNAFNKLITTIIYYISNQKIKTNHITITYSGSLTALSQKPIFKKLMAICEEYNVLINTSKMSSTMTVNLGLGAFGIALVSRYLIDSMKS